MYFIRHAISIAFEYMYMTFIPKLKYLFREMLIFKVRLTSWKLNEELNERSSENSRCVAFFFPIRFANAPLRLYWLYCTFCKTILQQNWEKKRKWKIKAVTWKMIMLSFICILSPINLLSTNKEFKEKVEGVTHVLSVLT